MERNFKEKSSAGFFIEKQINLIFKGLVSNLPQNLVAVKAKPKKSSSLCKGFIQIYIKDESERKGDEKNNSNSNKLIVSYAFYMKDFQDSKLESIAIYGDKIATKYYILKRKGYLFGYKIASLKIESGFRPFLDVKLEKSR